MRKMRYNAAKRKNRHFAEDFICAVIARGLSRNRPNLSCTNFDFQLSKVLYTTLVW